MKSERQKSHQSFKVDKFVKINMIVKHVKEDPTYHNSNGYRNSIYLHFSWKLISTVIKPKNMEGSY